MIVDRRTFLAALFAAAVAPKQFIVVDGSQEAVEPHWPTYEELLNNSLLVFAEIYGFRPQLGTDDYQLCAALAYYSHQNWLDVERIWRSVQ